MIVNTILSVITFGSLAVLQRATTTNGSSYTSLPLAVFAATAQEQVTVHSPATLCPYSFTYLSFAALFSASPLSLTFGSSFKAGRLLRKLLYVFIVPHTSRFLMYFYINLWKTRHLTGVEKSQKSLEKLLTTFYHKH